MKSWPTELGSGRVARDQLPGEAAARGADAVPTGFQALGHGAPLAEHVGAEPLDVGLTRFSQASAAGSSPVFGRSARADHLLLAARGEIWGLLPRAARERGRIGGRVGAELRQLGGAGRHASSDGRAQQAKGEATKEGDVGSDQHAR